MRVILVLVLVVLLATGAYSLSSEKELLEQIPASGLSQKLLIYTTPVPHNQERPAIGAVDAPLEVTVFVDHSPEGTFHLREQILPELISLIDEGKAKLVVRHAVDKEDLVSLSKVSKDNSYHDSRGKSLIVGRSLAVECFLRESASKEINVNVTLNNLSLFWQGAPVKEVDSCNTRTRNKFIANTDFLFQDEYDMIRGGTVGLNPVFYIGVGSQKSQVIGNPSWESLYRTIRNEQVQVGE